MPSKKPVANSAANGLDNVQRVILPILGRPRTGLIIAAKAPNAEHPGSSEEAVRVALARQ